ncbi:hypothetical protein EXU57_16070 [Segetibacter sp. 3557_3]|nr:hypothetical protein EXU57_16070 [Segetibacter sp. 3557_3]
MIAQDVDLFKVMDEDSKKADAKRTNYSTATFKTTRLINGHSVENVGKGILDFKISHRFNPVSDGIRELFGFDHASMRIGLDYGITDRLMIGAGRSTFQKQVDGFVKYKLLRQSSGYQNMPVTVSVLASVMLNTIANDTVKNAHFSDNLFYCYQLLIGRKFSENTSIQIMPTIIHRNIVQRESEPNDNIAIGIGGRQKISKRVSINAEYYYVLPEYKMPGTRNSLSFGVDIETGGHVFQLHFSNSMGMTERTFIAETDGRWGDGDIHFGFNIARVFVIGKKNKANRLKLMQAGEKY